ncbi:MAG: zinc metallopeptidase [Clostridia bacterium]|nr:zinc metallopeptidase [Clostridia bacterium]
MFFGYFYGDWSLIVVLPALIFTLWAQMSVRSAYRQYSQVRNSYGMTGADAARRILNQNGLHHIRIEAVRGEMTDHYDPRAGVIRLSEGVYNNASVAAVGIAAHEAGHAVQHATAYGALKLRNSIIPVCRFGSIAAMPLFIIGLLVASDALMTVGILAYAAVTLFQLITLPVEFNASRRAMKAIEGWGYMSDAEMDGSRRVLRAAAMTYVAALATSLLTLLRLLLIFSGGRNRR